MFFVKWIVVIRIWLSLFPAAAVRPSIAEWDDGRASTASRLVLHGEQEEDAVCTNQEEVAQHLRDLGLHEPGDPCGWTSVECKGCAVVELRTSKAQGDLMSLKHFPDLQLLDLSGGKITGDLEPLRHLTSLEELDLSLTQVVGGLEPLRYLTSLHELFLSRTQLVGGLDPLQNLTSLEELSLSQTQLLGGLEPLRHLTNLHWLYLSQTQVAGGLDPLQNLTSLRHLYLSQTQVVGGLEPLRHLTSLQLLYLSQTQVVGGLDPLQNLTALHNLYLSQTQVVGGLEPLQSLTNLKKLDLSQTQVADSLEPLQNLTALHNLYLSQTQVVGGLEPLRHLISLQLLYLSQTQVVGGLEPLQSLTMLRELSLSQTQVAGGLEPLRRLTSLQKLALRETNLTGLIDEIGTLPELIEADLSGAPLHGTLAAARCSKLRKLSVADTQVSEIRPRSFSNYYEFSSNPDNNWLPALQHLNVSGCPLKRSLADFLLPLAGTPVTVISAARCGLTGYMPDLYGIPAFVDNAWTQQWYSPLGRSLQVVDLSGNNIQHLRKVPVSLRIDVSRNGEALEVAPEVIRHCMQNDIELWLLETSLSNGEKVEEELRTMALDGFWMDSKNSYGCQSFLAPNVRVTPDVFWANGMCGCRPGYSGTGINCTACSRNSFNSQYNQSACQHCPANSTSAQASTSQDACQCRYGALFPTDSPNAEAKCHCPRREALSVADGDGQCISCSKHHLQCPEPGAVVSDAAVEPGFWRPKGSEKVYQCLDAERCSNSSCAPGYAGQLCAECADMHRSSGKRCVKCSDVPLKQRMPVIASVASAALAVMGVLAVWRYRSGSGSVPWSLRAQCVFRLLILELPMLLQLVQLWVVLGRLANTQVTAMVTAKKEKCLGDVLVSYLQALLLTSAEIQNFASLQCLFDPTTVRAVFAVATPVLPMLLLITCGFVDVARPGTGIRVGLKLLTLLYIGGASGTAQLLECQEVDGGGKVSLDFPFRSQFPHWLCKDALWVNWIGWSSAVCYGLMIPCCLAYLFAKQRVVMRQSDTFMMPAIKREGKWILTSQELMSKQGSKQLKDEKLLLAAAVANVAALAKGKAFVELREGTAIVSFADAGNVDEGFSVESIVFDAAETETLRYRSLTEMLIERSKLEDLDDRVMLGAKDLFCKYAKCQNVWVEVCSKVAAVALVSVVNSKDGLWLSIAITLGMALAIGLVRPFAQPQANALQTLGFASLALAAVGFRYHNGLSSLALALPFVLLMAQVFRPDSREAVALRMQQELQEKMPLDGPVELCADEVHFI